MRETKVPASNAGILYGLAAAFVCLGVMLATGLSPVLAGEDTEFPGTVLTVDQVTGKFAVKKDGGGSRFTFVADEKTKFSGTGLASLKELKKGDHVVVLYQVRGSQYLAASVTRK
jgi:hypothetical protein